MPHHVAVGIVGDDEVVFARAYAFHKFFGDPLGAHLGLQVVRGDFGRGNQHSVLAWERLFGAPVEEECDVGVLLGFRNVELA